MIKKSISLTAEGKKELEAELESLIKSRPEIAEKIATARAFGDLSENEEYSSARNEQKIAESRILEIQDILKNAKVIANRGHEKVGMGAKVTVSLSGKKYTYSIVGPVEANPLEGRISDQSPIGKAILGKRAGDEYVLPNGNKGKIVSVE